MEKIDILLATYNGEKYLSEQIESILNQTYSNFNLIISDDCSSDNTKNILNEYAKKDSRITLYFQKENLGYIRNFEFLLEKVESNIYALSDQDDIWLPEKIEKSIENMKSCNSDLVFGDLILIDKDGKEIYDSFWKYKKFDKKIKKDKYCKGLLLNNYITGCTIVSKKEFLKYILPLPKNTKYLIHDYWIGIVVALKGKISHIDVPYIKYRQHNQNQIGSSIKSKQLSSIEEIRNLFLDVKIEHFDIFNKYKDLFDEQTRKQNEEALKYFKMLKEKKNINFKKWGLYYKLYHYENIIYFLANFVILNFPLLAKLIYKRR